MIEPAERSAEFARTIAWLMRTQALLSAAAGVGFAVFGGVGTGIAALTGGFAGLFVTAIIGLRIALSGDGDAQQMVRAFYRAMALKFALAVILFVIVAKWFPGYFGPVLTGYFVSLMAYWLAMRKLLA